MSHMRDVGRSFTDWPVVVWAKTVAFRRFTLVLVILALAGWSGSFSHAQQNVRKALVFGSDHNYPPFEWLDKRGRPQGFNVDLIRAIGEVMGYDVVVRLGPWEQIRAELEVHRTVDVVDMYFTDERAAIVDYADPFWVIHDEIFIRRDTTGIGGLEDLIGKEVLCEAASTAHDNLRRIVPGAKPIPVEGWPGALRMLAAGDHDCAIGSRIGGRYVIVEYNLYDLVAVGPPLWQRDYCFVTAKGRPELLADLNEGLALLKRTGRFDDIYDKWFAERLPPQPWKTALFKALPWVLLGAAALALGAAAWVLTLRRQVRARTRSLQAELVARRQAEQELAIQYRLLRMAGETARFGGWTVEIATNRVTWSDVVAEIHGMPPGCSPLVSEGIAFYAPEWRPKITESFTACAEKGVPYDEELEIVTHSGNRIWVRTVGEAVKNEAGDIVQVQGSFQDIDDRKRMQAESEWLARFPSENPNPVLRITLAGQIEYANAAAAAMIEAIAEEGGNRLKEEWRSHMEAAMRANRPDEVEIVSGKCRFIATLAPVAEHGYLNVYARDITKQHTLEAMLRQSQKMESIGRLAGGVAHDFNNLLMGIMNHVELCRGRIEPDHPIREWLDEVTHDAQRSAALVRQLLAFARKQAIAPVVLNLNDAVPGTLKMLRRLIGEDIGLRWQPGADVPPVRMDPAQLDQVLANLCVNARDAIDGVGAITIETARAAIGEEYCADHAEAVSGDFVVLVVSDDGHGMDNATLAHLFEPFFTTKGVGKGSGLGLATIYGIVKQNSGFLNVHSEPCQGTTFRIYLPRCEEEPVAVAMPSVKESRIGGAETILLVEDEKSVRVTTCRFLADLGYTVLVAETPEEAFRIVAAHEAEIHLVITDVIMPGMNGCELAEKLLQTRPRIRCLFMSGYTADVIARSGLVENRAHFLCKPFGRDDLAQKVREVLNGC